LNVEQKLEQNNNNHKGRKKQHFNKRLQANLLYIFSIFFSSCSASIGTLCIVPILLITVQ